MSRKESNYDTILPSNESEQLFVTEQSSVVGSLKNGFVIVNTILSGLVNFGLNGGLGFLIYRDNDAIGVWSTPDSEKPVSTSMTVDLWMTSLFVVFFTTLLNTGPIRKEIKKGTITPLNEEELQHGVWRFFPFWVTNPAVRSLLFALELMLFYFGATLLLLATLCAAQVMGKVCYINKTDYCWFKGAWTMVLAMIAYPLGYLGSINRANLSPDIFQALLERQKQQEPHSLPSPVHSTP